jgi:hypothetical protein
LKDYYSVSSRVVLSTESLNRLPEAMRVLVNRSSNQVHNLTTDVSYDMTHILMWFVMLLLLVAGQYEIALVLGGLKMLSHGRGAAKQTT